MRQQRIRRPTRAVGKARTARQDKETTEPRPEIREDIRKAWFEPPQA